MMFYEYRIEEIRNAAEGCPENFLPGATNLICGRVYKQGECNWLRKTAWKLHFTAAS